MRRQDGHMPQLCVDEPKMVKQTMVFTGAHELLTKIFVGKKFTVMSKLKINISQPGITTAKYNRRIILP